MTAAHPRKPGPKPITRFERALLAVLPACIQQFGGDSEVTRTRALEEAERYASAAVELIENQGSK